MMDSENNSQVIGSVAVVYGQVEAESADGITCAIKLNDVIRIDDRIDTGQNGSVTIVFNDAENSQLDLGRMTDMVVDQDVFAGDEVLELSDAAAEPGILQNLLDGWDAFEPAAALEDIIPDGSETSDGGDTIDSENSMGDHAIFPGGGEDTDLASSEAGDDGVSSIDDDLDLTNFIPPPDDAA